MRAYSADAASRFADASLCLVYVDANHGEAAVADDLARYWPKVRPGGVMAGHDYTKAHAGVARAVHAFLADGPHDGAWRWGDGSALGGAGPAPTLYLTDVQVPRADVHGALIPPCCPSWYFMKPAA